MDKRWPQGYLSDDQWVELLGLEYALTHYPRYFVGNEFNKSEDRLSELRKLKHQSQNKE